MPPSSVKKECSAMFLRLYSDNNSNLRFYFFLLQLEIQKKVHLNIKFIAKINNFHDLRGQPTNRVMRRIYGQHLAARSLLAGSGIFIDFRSQAGLRHRSDKREAY